MVVVSVTGGGRSVGPVVVSVVVGEVRVDSTTFSRWLILESSRSMSERLGSGSVAAIEV